jgi:hypothetical protein
MLQHLLSSSWPVGWLWSDLDLFKGTVLALFWSEWIEIMKTISQDIQSLGENLTCTYTNPYPANVENMVNS